MRITVLGETTPDGFSDASSTLAVSTKKRAVIRSDNSPLSLFEDLTLNPVFILIS